jgi:hypothetical protein
VITGLFARNPHYFLALFRLTNNVNAPEELMGYTVSFVFIDVFFSNFCRSQEISARSANPDFTEFFKDIYVFTAVQEVSSHLQ